MHTRSGSQTVRLEPAPRSRLWLWSLLGAAGVALLACTLGIGFVAGRLSVPQPQEKTAGVAEAKPTPQAAKTSELTPEQGMLLASLRKCVDDPGTLEVVDWIKPPPPNTDGNGREMRTQEICLRTKNRAGATVLQVWVAVLIEGKLRQWTVSDTDGVQLRTVRVPAD